LPHATRGEYDTPRFSPTCHFPGAQNAMHRPALQFALALCLCGSGAVVAMAAPADDQYAVAAGHYRRARWPLAVTEFQSFLDHYSEHAKAADARFFLAEALVQSGKLKEANRAFEELLRVAPEHRYRRQAMFRAGETAYLVGDHELAAKWLKEFRGSYSDDPLNEFALAYLGEIALMKNQYATAQTLFEETLRRYPDGKRRNAVRLGLAKAQAQSDRRENAIATFKELAESDGTLGDDALFQLAATYYAGGEHERAVESFADFERRFPESPLIDRVKLGRAWALFRLERYEDSLAVLKPLVERPKVGNQARYWLGLCYKATEHWNEAATELEALAEQSDEPLALSATFHAGEARLLGGEPERALIHFEAVARTRDAQWHRPALLGRLRAEIARGNPDAVDAAIQEIAQQFPGSESLAEARRLKAEWLLNDGNAEAAIELLESDSGDVSQSVLLARAYYERRQFVRALATLDGDLANDEARMPAEAHWLRASILIALKRHDEAAAALRRFLALKPDSPRADEGRIQLSACLARSGQEDEARRVFETMFSERSAENLPASAIADLADAAFAAERFAWAAELFQSVLEAEERELAARALAGLAWSRWRLNEPREAAELFRRFMDDYPNHPLFYDTAIARGQVLEELNQAEAALAIYRNLTQRPVDHARKAEAWLAAASVCQRLERYDEAAALLDSYLAQYPDHEKRPAALYRRGWVARQSGDAKGAEQAFAALHDEHRDSSYWSDATYRLTELAFQEGDVERAIALADELVGAGKNDEVALHALYLKGQALAVQGKWADVRETLTKLLARKPDEALREMATYWLAEADYRLGDFEAADQRLEELAVATAESEESWVAMIALRRAQIRAHRKEWDAALEVAQQIEPRFPQFAQQYEADYVIGRCLAMQAQFEQAREAYRRVTASAQGSATETAAMAQWMIGETYFHQKDFRTAIREYLRLEVLYDYPQWQSAALLQAGKCYEQLEDFGEARALYARLLKDFPQTKYADEASRRLKTASGPRRERS